MSIPETYKALRGGENGEAQIKELPLPKPGKNQVLVKIEFTPVNATDFIRMTWPDSPVGSEGSGTIAALGEDLKVSHKVGDKVHVLAVELDRIPHVLGTYSEYLVVSAESCAKIQDGLSLEVAACHFYNPATVHYMGILAEREGHKAVVSSAASSTMGRMLIKYLKQKGIKTINIVRKDEYLEELQKEGGDYVLNSEAPDFESQLKELAEKEKATLAYDAIGGNFTGKLLRNLPMGSTCRIYGALGGQMSMNDVGLIDLILQEKVVRGLTTNTYLRERNAKGEIQKLFEEVHSLLPTVFKVKIQKVFKFEELKEALAYYKENSSKGKILLKLN